MQPFSTINTVEGITYFEKNGFEHRFERITSESTSPQLQQLLPGDVSGFMSPSRPSLKTLKRLRFEYWRPRPIGVNYFF